MQAKILESNLFLHDSAKEAIKIIFFSISVILKAHDGFRGKFHRN